MINNKNKFDMKKATKSLVFLLTALVVIVSSCKKDNSQPKAPEFTKFSFEPGQNAGLQGAVVGVIAGDQINVRIPNSANINELVASFTLSQTNAIAYIGSEVQQSAVSKQNFSSPVKYKLVTESGSTEYTVNALTNASLLSFGFYKEDNAGVLFKDYEATISGLQVAVELPVDADISKLVSRFTTSAGATVKVSGQAQTSKTTMNNFTNPLTYELTDTETTTPEKYVVTVGRLTAPAWSLLPMGILSTEKASGLRMAIHPVSNQPYLVYSLPSDADRKVVATAYDGAAWAFLGAKTGFSTARGDEASIAIDNNGVVYSAYKDYDPAKTQYASVQKFQNGVWSYVNAQQFNDHRVNYIDLAIGDDNVPVIGYTAAFAEGGLAKRAPYTYRYESGNWVGKAVSGTTAATFSRTVKGNDGLVYYIVMDMTVSTAARRPTVYRWKNNTWEVVGSPLIDPGSDIYGAAIIDATVSHDGQVYIAFQSQPTAEKKSYVMHYNGTTWKQIGDEISHEPNPSSNADRDNIALAVHPNGTLFFAYGDATGLFVTTFNKQTNNWNAKTTLQAERIDKIDLKISKDGIPYIAAGSAENARPIVYKFDIPSI